MLLGISAALLGLLLCHPGGAAAPCGDRDGDGDGDRDSPECRERAGIPACSAACRAALSLESPLFPGNGHLEPLSESVRKYVMSHFRWNKFGNGSSAGSHKREEETGNSPIPNSQRREEPGAARGTGKRSYSMEHFRWGKPVGRKRRPVKVYPNGAEEEPLEYPLESRRDVGGDSREEEEEEEGRDSRWEWPLEKRYGGFLGPERGRIPLVTLFRNTIGKSAAKKGQ